MNSESYFFDYDNEKVEYSFDSIGPKGIIRKKAHFLQTNLKSFFILAYGDYDSEKDEIDEFIVTNNNDTNKLISTMLKITIDFLRNNPNVYVQFSWRDELRTRLFNSWINRNLSLMNHSLILYGLIGETNNETWERYKENQRYKAVFVKLRNKD